jgi:hypothetical protein
MSNLQSPPVSKGPVAQSEEPAVIERAMDHGCILRGKYYADEHFTIECVRPDGKTAWIGGITAANELMPVKMLNESGELAEWKE